MNKALFEEFYPKIYNFVYYRVLHKEKAEDITGDIFIKALTNADKFDGNKAAYSTWLFTISRNCIANYYRDKKNEIAIDDVELVSEDDADSALFLDEEKKRLHMILRGMGERDRTVLSLRYWGGFSYSEIAEHMGITVNSVGVTLKRAVKKIRDAW
jgi:RNA polymerase sigma-70 factor (ECF subfamily)